MLFSSDVMSVLAGATLVTLIAVVLRVITPSNGQYIRELSILNQTCREELARAKLEVDHYRKSYEDLSAAMRLKQIEHDQLQREVSIIRRENSAYVASSRQSHRNNVLSSTSSNGNDDSDNDDDDDVQREEESRFSAWVNRVFTESELKDLCFEAGIDFEGIEGETKQNKINSLIVYARNRGLLVKLMRTAAGMRREIKSW